MTAENHMGGDPRRPRRPSSSRRALVGWWIATGVFGLLFFVMSIGTVALWNAEDRTAVGTAAVVEVRDSGVRQLAQCVADVAYSAEGAFHQASVPIAFFSCPDRPRSGDAVVVRYAASSPEAPRVVGAEGIAAVQHFAPLLLALGVPFAFCLAFAAWVTAKRAGRGGSSA